MPSVSPQIYLCSISQSASWHTLAYAIEITYRFAAGTLLSLSWFMAVETFSCQFDFGSRHLAMIWSSRTTTLDVKQRLLKYKAKDVIQKTK
jgi:hypothetical protein